MSPVQHTSLGVWDLYEDTSYVSHSSPPSEFWAVFTHALPFVWRMLCEIASIRRCAYLLACYVLVYLLSSIVPAIALSYSGQLLAIVQSAVEHRSIDTRLLISVVFGAFLSASANRLLSFSARQISKPLHREIKRYYSIHIFQAYVRLDVPTFNDPAIQRKLEECFPNYQHNSLAFLIISTFLRTSSQVIQLVTQSIVLFTLLRTQPDGLLLAFLCFLHAFCQRPASHSLFVRNRVWLATTKNKDYLRSEGLKQVVSNPDHRQEIVASGLAPFLLALYRKAVTALPTHSEDFYEAMYEADHGLLYILRLILPDILRTLPELYFAIRAVQQPSSIPISLASLNLITQTSQSFVTSTLGLLDDAEAATTALSQIVSLYEIVTIPNRVKVVPEKASDPTDSDDPSLGRPFPEDSESLRFGISIEFCQVSFKYPGSDLYALDKVSFKIEKGQLCVIVGNNGSGKSTILKLIARLYDPTEGQILIDGIDIKTIRLADLRRSVSVLFQDYTIFPLSIGENIGLGDPPHFEGASKIQRAAHLGGADAFIEKLPHQYDTYLDRPVLDFCSSDLEGTGKVNGKTVDFTQIREAAGIKGVDGGGGAGNRGLSGGQMQRIALSRTFMRSVVSDESVGLLLFDEPSASLDPTAEHDLFERLRELRGNKTMIFSSHRFGNLTRHADLILYMNDSKILEEGTHDQLIRKDGEYARIWNLQARAFL